MDENENTHEEFMDKTCSDELLTFDELIPDPDIFYLSETDQIQMLQAADLKGGWADCKISSVGESVEFSLDDAKKDAWKAFIGEVEHLKMTIPSLIEDMIPTRDYLDFTSSSNILSNLFCLALGEKSGVSILLCKELNIDRRTLCCFLGTLCLQMSYAETPASLFDVDSELRQSVLMDKEMYLKIWTMIATRKKVSLTNFVGTSRRNECLWEMMERVVNTLLRSISVAGRTDEIIIALDDDKIWVETSGANQLDDFGLRKVTHVKDNRKGIIAHTAVSSTTNLPLCFMFERKGDNAVDCFKRIFGHLFPSSNPSHLPDLNGIRNHSDRGYAMESTIFKFLLPAGADFTNTVRQVMPFPFFWSARSSRSASETRQKLTETGAPTLFVKEIVQSNRVVSCNAFRTGTQNISTTISTVIHGHRWEGFCANQLHRIAYEKDPEHGLDDLIFQRIAKTEDDLFYEENKNAVNELLQKLRLEKINVLTLEQGTADWHRGRQFSLTSSQTDAAFQKAFIVNQQSADWRCVAQFLYGPNYHSGKLYFYFIN